jgi:Endonuclease I
MTKSTAIVTVAVASVIGFFSLDQVHAQENSSITGTGGGVVTIDGNINEEVNVTMSIKSFDGCSVEEYYADLLAVGPVSEWTKEMVAELITRTHRNVLPSTSETSGGDDIYAALSELDRNPDRDDQVMLLYSVTGMAAVPAGTPESWGPERLWPVTRGAFRNTSAAFDVFNCRAEDNSVMIKKEGAGLLEQLPLFFGECGTVESAENCTMPATAETAEDTAQDAKIWLPPAVNRGDVARSLFYMQTRYEQEMGFALVDCPPFADGEYGYLSPLLNWHEADPVTDAEISRNNRACERWQGNRNPFIDFPQLVSLFYGQEDSIAEGTYTFNQCLDDVTESPTATPNPCSTFLGPGDIYTYLVNSDEPKSMIFYTLRDVPEVIGSLYVTDNAYNGMELLNNEGTIEVR